MSIARSIRPLLAMSVFGIAALAPATSRADDWDNDAAKIGAAKHSLLWNRTMAGKSYGHAEILINAPAAAVRHQVQNYGQYKDFAPKKFKQSRIIGKQGDQTDVYLSLSVMRGFITLEPVLRFAPPRTENGTEIVEGKLLRGNVKHAHVVFTFKQLRPDWTLLKADISLLPDFPAPQSMLDEELRDAARYAVDAIHNRAQSQAVWVEWPPAP